MQSFPHSPGGHLWLTCNFITFWSKNLRSFWWFFCPFPCLYPSQVHKNVSKLSVFNLLANFQFFLKSSFFVHAWILIHAKSTRTLLAEYRSSTSKWNPNFFHEVHFCSCMNFGFIFVQSCRKKEFLPSPAFILWSFKALFWS